MGRPKTEESKELETLLADSEESNPIQIPAGDTSEVVLERVVTKALLRLEMILDKKRLFTKTLFLVGDSIKKVSALIRPKAGDGADEKFMLWLKTLSPDQVDGAIETVQTRIALRATHPGRPPEPPRLIPTEDIPDKEPDAS